MGQSKERAKGNLNAFKHGRYSMHFSALGAVMASDPKLRNTLLALAERHGLKQAKAEEIGWEVLLRFLKHAGDIAAGSAVALPLRGLNQENDQTQNDQQNTLAPNVKTAPFSNFSKNATKSRPPKAAVQPNECQSARVGTVEIAKRI